MSQALCMTLRVHSKSYPVSALKEPMSTGVDSRVNRKPQHNVTHMLQQGQLITAGYSPVQCGRTAEIEEPWANGNERESKGPTREGSYKSCQPAPNT